MAMNGTNGTAQSIITNSTFVIADYTLALNATGSLLSVLGAIVMYWSYAYVTEVRTSTRKFLLFLTTADLVSAGGYLMGVVHYVVVVKKEDLNRSLTDDDRNVDDTDAICVIQSFILIFSNLAAYFWTIIISAHIAVAVVYGSTNRGVVFNIMSHMISWGIPAVIAITAAGCGVLGQDSIVRPLPWCFLRSQENHIKLIVWTIITSIGWELMTYLVTALMYIYMKFELHLGRRPYLQNDRSSMTRNDPVPEKHQMTRDDRKFLYVWLILYVLKIWGTVRLFIVTAHPDAYNDHYYKGVLTVLLNIQSFATTCQAFCNSVIFCVFDKAVRRKLASICCSNRGERQPLLAPFEEASL